MRALILSMGLSMEAVIAEWCARKEGLVGKSRSLSLDLGCDSSLHPSYFALCFLVSFKSTALPPTFHHLAAAPTLQHHVFVLCLPKAPNCGVGYQCYTFPRFHSRLTQGETE